MTNSTNGDEPESRIEALVADIETVKADLWTELENAKELTAQIKQLHATASTDQESITHIDADVKETASEVDQIRDAAKDDQTATQALATVAETLRLSIESRREEMEEVVGDSEALCVKVESLLPGATSTGLAKSFMDRKNDLVIGRRIWAILAIVPILVLVVIGLFGPGGLLTIAIDQSITWDLVARGLVWRLPTAAPLIWIAVFAGRHHLLALRLEEDYSFKEVLSRSFEGYKREMGDVESSEADTPLSVLCSNTLSSLSQAPGRLYDKKHTDFTPLNVALESIDPKVVESVAKAADITQEQVVEVIRRLFRP